MVDIFHLIKPKKKAKKNPLLSLINNPENYILIAQFEGDELCIRVKEKKHDNQTEK